MNYNLDLASYPEERLGVVLSHLTPREVFILTLRFGLRGSRRHTLGEVAEHCLNKWDIDDEPAPTDRVKVRIIEARALQMLVGLGVLDDDKSKYPSNE